MCVCVCVSIRIYVCPYVGYVCMCVRRWDTYMYVPVCVYAYVWHTCVLIHEYGLKITRKSEFVPALALPAVSEERDISRKKNLNYCILAPAWQYICCNTKIASFFYVCEIIYVIHADSHVMSFIYYISLGKCTLILLVKNDLATHLGQY